MYNNNHDNLVFMTFWRRIMNKSCNQSIEEEIIADRQFILKTN